MNRINQKMNIRVLSYSGLLIAIGVLLPQVFHLIGGQASGGIFLPMHIPVLIAGLLLGPLPGGIIGILTPLLSFAATGMPPAAKLPFMLFELAAYGIVSGLLSGRCNLYLALLIAQAAGRLVNALCLLAAMRLFHLNVPPVISVWTAIVTGIPGIVIQLVLIPPTILFIRKAGHLHE